MKTNSSCSKWKVYQTADNSYSLAFNSDTEMMHNQHGAFSETLHVYGPVVQSVLYERLTHPTFFSLGLGLGYVEMLIATFALQHQLQPTDLYIDTFELEDELKNEFTEWMKGEEVVLPYKETAQFFETHFSLEKNQISKFLLKMYESFHFQLFNAYTPRTQLTKSYSGVCYDAFSPKTNPELWSDASLENILCKAKKDFCVFGTYASTGSLKRILKKHNFQPQAQKGYGGKRECTLAIKKDHSQ